MSERKNENNTNNRYKIPYDFRDTVETIVDSMKTGTYTTPGVTLYQYDIDRCQHSEEINDGIVRFEILWSELLHRNPNIANIHPYVLQR